MNKARNIGAGKFSLKDSEEATPLASISEILTASNDPITKEIAKELLSELSARSPLQSFVPAVPTEKDVIELRRSFENLFGTD